MPTAMTAQSMNEELVYCLRPFDAATTVDCVAPAVSADAVVLALTVTPVLPDVLPLLLLVIVLVLVADVDAKVPVDDVVDAALVAKPDRR